MRREKLDTTQFKKNEKLYNNFIKYFEGSCGCLANYDDAKVYLKEIIYSKNLDLNSECLQKFVEEFDAMRKYLNDMYDLRVRRSKPSKELVTRLKYKIMTQHLKTSYANFAKFEIEFFDALDISLLDAKKFKDLGN